MKYFLVCALFLGSLPATAAPKAPKVKGTPASIEVTNMRRPSGSQEGPCAADAERMKTVAAESLAKAELDSDRHKLEISAGNFESAETWTTSANDGAVLNLSGTAKAPGLAREFFVEAQAVCSPATGKYELMSTAYHSRAMR